MKFKTKVIEIEAWREGRGEPMPGWVEKALKGWSLNNWNMLGFAGSVWNDKYGRSLPFRKTDWLIYNGDDDIYPCDEETFARKYEAVE